MGKFLGKLGVFQWSVHNVVAHPLSELVFLLSFGRLRRFSDWIHDCTIPVDRAHRISTDDRNAR